MLYIVMMMMMPAQLLFGNISSGENWTNNQFKNNSETTYIQIQEDRKICMSNPHHEDFLIGMELFYGLLITAVPFILVAIFNILMLKELTPTSNQLSNFCSGAELFYDYLSSITGTAYRTNVVLNLNCIKS